MLESFNHLKRCFSRSFFSSFIFGAFILLGVDNEYYKVIGCFIFVLINIKLSKDIEGVIKNNYLIFLVLLSIETLVSSAFSLDGISTKYFSYFSLPFVIVAYGLNDKEERKRIIIGFCYIGYSYLLMNIPSELSLFLEPSHRLSFLNQNPNALGHLAAVLAMFSILIFENKIAKLIFVLLSFFVILLTKSKTSIIALVVAVLVFVYLHRKRLFVDSRLFLIFSLVSTIVVLLMIISNVDAIIELYQMDSHRSLSNGTGRMDSWLFIVEEFLDSNFFLMLFGHGLGSIKDSLHSIGKSSVDSVWFYMLYESGIIAVGGLLLLFLYSFLFLRHHYFIPVIVLAFVFSIPENTLLGVGSIGAVLTSIGFFELFDRKGQFYGIRE